MIQHTWARNYPLKEPEGMAETVFGRNIDRKEMDNLLLVTLLGMTWTRVLIITTCPTCIPLGEPHAGDVLEHVDAGAVVEQQHQAQEAGGGRRGQQRPGRHRLQPVPHRPQRLCNSGVYSLFSSAANRLIGEVVQSRRRPLLGPSPG